eukprot:2580830-Rhodomonas_salina.1
MGLEPTSAMLLPGEPKISTNDVVTSTFFKVPLSISLRPRYAMSGTDMAYVGTAAYLPGHPLRHVWRAGVTLGSWRLTSATDFLAATPNSL